jgi:hypothetical protein
VTPPPRCENPSQTARAVFADFLLTFGPERDLENESAPSEEGADLLF